MTEKKSNNKFDNTFLFSWRMTCSLCKIQSFHVTELCQAKLNLSLRLHCTCSLSPKCKLRFPSASLYPPDYNCPNIHKGYWHSVRSVWLDFGQVHFLQKKKIIIIRTRPMSSHLDRESLANIGFLWKKRVLFSCEIKRVISRRQVSAIFYAWVVNHRPGFGLSCLLKKLTL